MERRRSELKEVHFIAFFGLLFLVNLFSLLVRHPHQFTFLQVDLLQ